MTLAMAAALAAAAVFGAAAVAQAIAARRVAGQRIGVTLLRRLLRQRMFQLAVALTLAGFALHLVALRGLPLYLAQAVVSSSVAVTALLAVLILGTRLDTIDWIAVGAVCLGLGFLAASAGSQGASAGSPALRALLLPSVLAVVAAGWGASRLPGPWAASLLGMLAGVGFAIVGIAARVLPDLSAGTLLTSAETYALLTAGPVAFLVYSVALQRGSVTTVSAALVVTQTAVPALVGVVALGDAVRPGWGVLAVVGFVLAAGGSSELARYDSGHARRDVPREPLSLALEGAEATPRRAGT